MEDFEGTVRRVRRRTAWIVVAGAVIGGIGGALIGTDRPSAVHEAIAVVACALALGGFAGAISLLIGVGDVTSDLQQPRAGLDRATKRAIAQSVRSATPILPPDGELARRAADDARAVVLLLPLRSAQLLMLYFGLAGTAVAQLTSDDSWTQWFSRIFLVTTVVVGGLFALSAQRKIAAARRYLRAVSDVDAAAAGESAHPVP